MPETKPELSTLFAAYIAAGSPSGTDYPDSGTGGNDGTLAGSAPYTPASWETDVGTINRPYVILPGKEGNSNSGSIDPGRIDLPIADSFATDVTIACWLRLTDGLDTLNLLSFADGVSNSGGIRAEVDSNERADVDDKTSRTRVNSSNLLVVDTWSHFCITLPLGGLGTVYLDGTAASGYFNRTTIPADEHGNEFGAGMVGARPYFGSTFRFCGGGFDLADLIIAKRALSTDEISWLANPANSYLGSTAVITTRRRRQQMVTCGGML